MLCVRCHRVFFVGERCPWCGGAAAEEGAAMTGPISPEEAAGRKQIPSDVFETFNALIAKNMHEDASTFKQGDVVAELVERGFARQRIFDDHLLDVEAAYEKAGWSVHYEKPGYNEAGEATFTFTRRPDPPVPARRPDVRE
jgi:RNA polymerase subunit RPABC4/transcription elongation factor Spt4